MLKKVLKWTLAAILAVFGLVMMTDALQDLSGTSPKSNSGSSTGQPEWNTSDVNIQTNGNLPIAAEAIKSLSPANGIHHNDPAAVLKTPWKYYGQLLCYSGMVELADDYPAGSNISNALQSTEAGEVVLVHNDGTIIDVFVVGGTGNLRIGQPASLCGLPIGRLEVQNRMGGTFTHLMFVGFSAMK